MRRNDGDMTRAGGDSASFRSPRGNPTHHDVDPQGGSADRPLGRESYHEIEDAINGIRWTEHDRWILQSWQRAILDIRLRHQFVDESAVDRARHWCRVNPGDRKEIAALVVELIRSDHEVQRALLEWACRISHSASGSSMSASRLKLF